MQKYDRAEPATPAKCCKNLDDGMYCQPDCQRYIQNDETAAASETGFYWKFNSDPDTGRPYGCSGLDSDPKWAKGVSLFFYKLKPISTIQYNQLLKYI